MSAPTPPTITSKISAWLPPLLYPVGSWVLQSYFRQIQVTGQQHLPLSGPVIFAPLHRSRWDAIVIPYVAGQRATGRHLHYMVSHDEMLGFQGWVIRHFGGFPVNTRQPSIASLRHGVDLLSRGEPLVIFPEGNIFREPQVQPLHSGLARLALQATLARGQADLKIIPIALQYSQPFPHQGDTVKVAIGEPLQMTNYDCSRGKQVAQQITTDLKAALTQLQQPTPAHLLTENLLQIPSSVI